MIASITVWKIVTRVPIINNGMETMVMEIAMTITVTATAITVTALAITMMAIKHLAITLR